jgi:hypothetical protein
MYIYTCVIDYVFNEYGDINVIFYGMIENIIDRLLEVMLKEGMRGLVIGLESLINVRVVIGWELVLGVRWLLVIS